MFQVFITGAGGFIGSHVVEAFLAAGHRVRALVRYRSTGRRGWLDHSPTALAAEGEGRLEIVRGDVTDAHQMLALAEGQDVIVHMAALIGIPYSYEAPASYVATNVGGTLNILEAARRHGPRRVIVTSTSEVYGTAQTPAITEEHPLHAQSPYAATKTAADQLALSYHRTFGVPVVVLRPFNTYGPRQSQRAVIPTIIAQALSGSGEIRLGNLEPRRDVTFVTDTACAFVLAAEAKGIEGETIHFGSGEAHSVRELAEWFLTMVDTVPSLGLEGTRPRIVADAARVRPASSEVELLLCDPSKAQRLLGWAPSVGLGEGMMRTAEFLCGRGGGRAGEYTR